MTFAEVRTYVKGIIKGFFLNKKILDKFSYSSYDNSDTLLYDDYPISERISINALNKAINADAAELYFGHDGHHGGSGVDETLVSTTQMLAINTITVNKNKNQVKGIYNISYLLKSTSDEYPIQILTMGIIRINNNISSTTNYQKIENE
jgi:hypothetical protein